MRNFSFSGLWPWVREGGRLRARSRIFEVDVLREITHNFAVLPGEDAADRLDKPRSISAGSPGYELHDDMRISGGIQVSDFILNIRKKRV